MRFELNYSPKGPYWYDNENKDNWSIHNITAYLNTCESERDTYERTIDRLGVLWRTADVDESGGVIVMYFASDDWGELDGRLGGE